MRNNTPITNTQSWLIFEQMMAIAAAKLKGFFDDVAIIDASCMATHDPTSAFYWLINQQGTHWGAANLPDIDWMMASLKVYRHHSDLECYTYTPGAGLKQTTPDSLQTTMGDDARRIEANPSTASKKLPLPAIPNHLRAAATTVWSTDADLNNLTKLSCSARYICQETLLAWTAPRKFYAFVKDSNWSPRIWPADNHLFFLLAAQNAVKHYGPEHEERWLPITYIYRNRRLEQVTMQEMQADIAQEIARRQSLGNSKNRTRPARKPQPPLAPAPVMPTTQAAQPTCFSA